jgi:mercuric ion transport protein
MAHNGLRKASLIGGALAALVASLCCLGPLVLVTAGVSGAWIAGLAAFEPWLLFWIMCAMLVLALGYPYTARFFY